MKDLIEICAAAGGENVQSYIQSGNVIFRTDAAIAGPLPLAITAQIAERFGYRIPVIVRTATEIKVILQSNPFRAQRALEETLHVMFLADLPSPEKVATLDPARSAPDAFIVQNQEIYLHLPSGAADTKLTNAYFDAKLATISPSSLERADTTTTAADTLYGNRRLSSLKPALADAVGFVVGVYGLP